jgi:hypothetical protein
MIIPFYKNVHNCNNDPSFIDSLTQFMEGSSSTIQSARSNQNRNDEEQEEEQEQPIRQVQICRTLHRNRKPPPCGT